MDIYNFFNSQDIADHCRSLGHQFNTMEAAFLVNNAYNLTIKERHEAYREIIATMPDMPEWSRHPTRQRYASLHQALKDYMEIEKKILAVYYRGTDRAAYRFGYYSADDRDIMEYHDDYTERLFDSTERLMEVIKAENEDRHYKYVIIKKWFNTGHFIRVTITPGGEPLECASRGILSENDEDLHEELFDNMWVKIPTPFKRGDLVIGSTPWNIGATELGNEPFVLENICYWNKGVKGREYEGCDSSDMTAFGYWINDDGLPYSECMHAYHNLKYYRGEFAGDSRILTAISNDMKGEINNYALFLTAYETIRNEGRLADNHVNLARYTEEGQRLAGLTCIGRVSVGRGGKE
jgi:hypothetical protein